MAHDLKDDIIKRLQSTEQLSAIFPSILILAKQIKDKELEKWVLLEMNGYLNTNPSLTEDIKVPSYRIVPGQFYDLYNRPLIITDPKLSFINEYRLRQSIKEIEEMSKTEGLMSIHDAHLTNLIWEGLKVKVHTFDFSAKSTFGILESIKTIALNKLFEVLPEQTHKIKDNEINDSSIYSVSNLHPSIKRVSLKLFEDGHYRQAILDAYIHLIELVQTKSGCYTLDGVPLMQTVFSVKNPVIKVSNDPDEQIGVMWLFSGAVMAIRNVKAHKIKEQDTLTETIEWLCFASSLLKILDRSEVIFPGDSVKTSPKC